MPAFPPTDNRHEAVLQANLGHWAKNWDAKNESGTLYGKNLVAALEFLPPEPANAIVHQLENGDELCPVGNELSKMRNTESIFQNRQLEWLHFVPTLPSQWQRLLKLLSTCLPQPETLALFVFPESWQTWRWREPGKDAGFGQHYKRPRQ
jgi:hypothetical protein